MRTLSLFAMMLLAGCEVLEQPSGMISHYTTAYKQVIKENDSQRLRDWRRTFEAAIASASVDGHRQEIAREGALLEPDAAIGSPSIPDGLYRCRVIKLGARDPGNRTYASYGGFTCRIGQDQQLQRLTKLSGPQRYVGLIFPSDPIRSVFLGTLALADETRALQYGQDQQRDVAGYVERIGPDRWRLVMPEPHFESSLDVMELVAEGATR